MSNAVYELCPVTSRVLDKNRLLCADEVPENFNARTNRLRGRPSFGLVARIARAHERFLERLIDETPTLFRPRRRVSNQRRKAFPSIVASYRPILPIQKKVIVIRSHPTFPSNCPWSSEWPMIHSARVPRE